MSVETIRWSSQNFVGSFDSRWTLTNATVADNTLSLAVGGKAVLVLTKEVDVEFKYLRVFVKFSSTGITVENNFRNKPTIFLQEAYKDDEGLPYRYMARSLGFNATNYDATEDKYTDATIVTTLDRRMKQFKIVIQNDSPDPLIIYDFACYQSKDLPEEQLAKRVSTVVNSVVKEGSADIIKAYRNADGSINGLGVFIQGSSEELKFRPAYFNGELIAINTNFGQTIDIQSIREQIDLTSSSETTI